jgi:hypothetical protein
MAIFKCTETNNTVEFDLEHDIRTMRQHPGYVEVLEEVKPVVEIKEKKTVAKSKAE